MQPKTEVIILSICGEDSNFKIAGPGKNHPVLVIHFGKHGDRGVESWLITEEDLMNEGQCGDQAGS